MSAYYFSSLNSKNSLNSFPNSSLLSNLKKSFEFLLLLKNDLITLIIISLEKIEKASKSTTIESIFNKYPSNFLFNRLMSFPLASPLK